MGCSAHIFRTARRGEGRGRGGDMAVAAQAAPACALTLCTQRSIFENVGARATQHGHKTKLVTFVEPECISATGVQAHLANWRRPCP